MVHLILGVPISLHDGVALLKVLCIFGNVIGVARLCVFGLASVGLSVRIPPFPGAVRDANGETDPGKGSEDDLAVLDMCPLLVIQVEGPQVTVNEEVQLNLRLRESGCHGIANRKCVELSDLSEMYSKDALKTMIEQRH